MTDINRKMALANILKAMDSIACELSSIRCSLAVLDVIAVDGCKANSTNQTPDSFCSTFEVNRKEPEDDDD